MDNFGLYLIITKPQLPYEEIARIAVEEEIRMLQLREKHLSDRELLSIGEKIIKITENTSTRLIINDRPDIALLLSADGYHLGQDDLPLAVARKIYPSASLCGVSTHNLAQADLAFESNPDYIGFGPVYATPTKEVPDPVVGLNNLSKVLSIAKIPVVAIGGIDGSNIEDVLRSGARNIALVRYFMQTKELKERIRRVKAICNHFWRNNDPKTICPSG